MKQDWGEKKEKVDIDKERWEEMEALDNLLLLMKVQNWPKEV